MIKKLTNFFCMLPLILTFIITHIAAADHKPPTDKIKEKEQIEDCIDKIREKQEKIKDEVEEIKRLIRDRKNRLDKDQA
jgi:hypothetical protein